MKKKTFSSLALILVLVTGILFLVTPIAEAEAETDSWETVETYNNPISQDSRWKQIETYNNDLNEGITPFDKGNLGTWYIDISSRSTQKNMDFDKWDVQINDYFNWKTVETFLNSIHHESLEEWIQIESYLNDVIQLGEFVKIDSFLNQITQSSKWKQVESFTNDITQLVSWKTVEIFTNEITNTQAWNTIETYTNSIKQGLKEGWEVISHYSNELNILDLDEGKPLVPVDTIIKNIFIPLVITLAPAFAFMEALPRELRYGGFIIGFSLGIVIVALATDIPFGILILFMLADGLIIYKGGT